MCDLLLPKTEHAWSPQVVGSHLSRKVQLDVVAISWQTRHILLGECKWGDDTVSRTTAQQVATIIRVDNAMQQPFALALATLFMTHCGT
jgi:hypothetical protein